MLKLLLERLSNNLHEDMAPSLWQKSKWRNHNPVRQIWIHQAPLLSQPRLTHPFILYLCLSSIFVPLFCDFPVLDGLLSVCILPRDNTYWDWWLRRTNVMFIFIVYWNWCQIKSRCREKGVELAEEYFNVPNQVSITRNKVSTSWEKSWTSIKILQFAKSSHDVVKNGLN